jgi:hypothetical protein
VSIRDYGERTGVITHFVGAFKIVDSVKISTATGVRWDSDDKFI